MSHELPERNEQERAVTQRIIEFADGNSGVSFSGEDGTELAWDSTNKWFDNPARRTANTTIVLTESGNQYVFGKGLIVDSNKNRTYVTPQGGDDLIPPLTFGEDWTVPGVFKTSKVRAVMSEYKTGATGDRVLDQESPFIQANKILESKLEKMN